MTRILYSMLNQRQRWSDLLTLNAEAIAELQFWKASLHEYNSQPIWRQPSAVRVVYSDAPVIQVLVDTLWNVVVK